MKSYLFILTGRSDSRTVMLREIPVQWRTLAAALPVGGKVKLPSGNELISLDSGKNIPDSDFAALCEAEVAEAY